MAEKNIVVLGAGVIGLTCALSLSSNPRYRITVCAKHMPGDYDISYASPWAGANYDTYAELGSRLNRLEKDTWPYLRDLARNSPDAAIHFQDTKCVMRTKDQGTEKYQAYENSSKNYPWLKHWKLPREELPKGVDEVVMFQSVCINTAIYLPWLVSQCLKNGVIFRRVAIDHIGDAAGFHASGKPAHLVVNCSGLGAKALGGVEDQQLYPVRGQTVLVREENDSMYAVSGTDGPADDRDYQMMRAAGGGTVLGGCSQEGSWDGQVDLDLAERIKQRAIKACPALIAGKDSSGTEGLSVIRHGVGLRPARHGGPRIELETFSGLELVHCYGHAGAGYQQSYGSAVEVLSLLEQVFS